MLLQSKDELISSLKSGNGTLTDNTADLEMQEITLERDMLRDEVVKLRDATDKLARLSSERDAHHKRDCAELREQTAKLEQLALAESHRNHELETAVKAHSADLAYVRSEATRKEQSLQQRLRDREEELQRMRRQLLTTRSESRSPTDGELESRMRVLTENLIQKQSAIETLNAEKHSMSVQIDRLEKRLRDAPTKSESRITVAAGTISGSDDGGGGGGGGGRVGALFSESTSDSRVARHLKKAYTSVDRFSFRLGVFLRRYPLARVMVIAYMLLLHFWVLVVLLTYTPEIHGGGDHPEMPGRK